MSIRLNSLTPCVMAPKPRLVRGQTPIRTIWMDGWLWWWDGCWVVVVVVVWGGVDAWFPGPGVVADQLSPR